MGRVTLGEISVHASSSEEAAAGSVDSEVVTSAALAVYQLLSPSEALIKLAGRAVKVGHAKATDL